MQSVKSDLRLTFVFAMVALTFTAWSQVTTAQSGLQDKIQAMEKAGAENARRLQGYQWIETTTVALNGSPKPPQQFICRYTSYGTMMKTPIGPPAPPPQVGGGPLRRHIAEKKIEEVQRSLMAVRELTARYLPLNRDAMQQALHNRRIDLEYDGTRGNSIVIHDYAKAGDKLILSLNFATMQIRSVQFESYLDSPGDGVTGSVDFAILPDGTSYPNITHINAPGKHISIVTVASNVSRPVQ